jgi:hypothetical protein
MVPAEFSIFFVSMAAVGATLFGLIFVAILISPESVAAANAPVERQVKATAAYIALLNPLTVSLFALVPHQLIGIAVTVLSWIGLLNALAMLLTLRQEAEQGNTKLSSSIFVIVSFVLNGFEAFIAIRLLRYTIELYWFSLLADVLIFLTLYGIIRAWEFIGIRQFHVRDWIKTLQSKKEDETWSKSNYSFA